MNENRDVLGKFTFGLELEPDLAARTPTEPILPYVIISGGLVQDGAEGRIIIDMDVLDDEPEDDLDELIAQLESIGDELAARNLTHWSEGVEDRLRELNPEIVRPFVAPVPDGAGPQMLILQGGIVQETFNADGLLIVDLDEMDDIDVTDERRRELLVELAAAGGSAGNAYEQIRLSVDRVS
jgi:hypothetical protein